MKISQNNLFFIKEEFYSQEINKLFEAPILVFISNYLFLYCKIALSLITLKYDKANIHRTINLSDLRTSKSK